MRICAKPVLAALLLFAGPALLWAQVGAAPVRVFKVRIDDLAPEQPFVGTVMPSKKAIVGSAVDGRVIEFPVNQGDYVESKAVLAQLLTETIGKELATAIAERSLRQAELAEMNAGSREEEKEQAKARMDAAKARMDYTAARLQRLQSLARQGRAVSSEELDEAVSASDAASSTYREAAAGHKLAELGPREEHKLQAAARLAMQVAVVEKLEDQIEKHSVRTRFPGWVSAEFTEVGDWLNRGDPVAEIVALDVVEIEVYVVEDHVPHVKRGALADVIVPALKREFPGEIDAVVPQADPRSRTFPVRIAVTNEMESDAGAGSPSATAESSSEDEAPPKKFSPVIKAGMLAEVWLPTGPKQKGPVVRKDALVFSGAQKSVWLIDPKTVKPVEINGSRSFQGEAVNVAVNPTVEARELVLVPQRVPVDYYVVTEGNERVRPAGPGKPALVYWPAEDESAARSAANRR